MSIASQIERLTTLRNNIRAKLVDLGIMSSSAAVTFNNCYAAINNVDKQTQSGTVNINDTFTGIIYSSGYYPNEHAVEHVVTTVPNPTITVSSAGLITASSSWTKGFTTNASYSATKQLSAQAAKTWTPTTSNQTIASGKYLTGTQTIKGDANLKAANIAKDVKIFGITGTHQGGTDVSDATATAANITSGKTAYIASGKVTGTYVPYLEFTNKSVAASAFSEDTTYSEFPYRAAVACSGATANMFPYVEFSPEDKVSGCFCYEAQSYAGGVYIYAIEALPATIDKITFYKRS